MRSLVVPRPVKVRKLRAGGVYTATAYTFRVTDNFGNAQPKRCIRGIVSPQPTGADVVRTIALASVCGEPPPINLNLDD